MQMNMDAVQKLPIGIQDFEKLRKQGYLYVDKTHLVYKLVNEGSYYFLSRPRRFGKSLFLSTVKAYLEGKKELFEGLAIEQLEKDWVKYPILYMDLNAEKYDTKESLDQRIDAQLKLWESQYPTGFETYSHGIRFERIIKAAYEKTGQRVVILVDEYDKPLLQAIGNDELQEQYRGILKGFYGALKSMDGCIKFAMLTGVTKFRNASVFGGLDNLNDISMDKCYYDICGITEKELLGNFQPNINLLAERNQQTMEEAVEKLRNWCGGYHFCENTPGMCNPFSVLNTLNKQKYGSYWFETGMPTYLVDLLRMHAYNLETMSQIEVDENALTGIYPNYTSTISVIYQSGYLTIKDYDPKFCIYTLGFPNEEVAEGFVNLQRFCQTTCNPEYL